MTNHTGGPHIRIVNVNGTLQLIYPHQHTPRTLYATYTVYTTSMPTQLTTLHGYQYN